VRFAPSFYRRSLHDIHEIEFPFSPAEPLGSSGEGASTFGFFVEVEEKKGTE
jgi:hypothetical protein